jgi:hypothetical protein
MSSGASVTMLCFTLLANPLRYFTLRSIHANAFSAIAIHYTPIQFSSPDKLAPVGGDYSISQR